MMNFFLLFNVHEIKKSENKVIQTYSVFALTNSILLNAAKMWCYCRTTYMPMSYLYGRKYHGPITDLVKEIREEIHTKPYADVEWNKARHDCCKVCQKSTKALYILQFLV